jgi:hypothetical protein
MRCTLAPVLVLSLALLVAACGDDSSATTTPVSATAVAIDVTVSGGTVTVTVDGAAASDHVSVALGSQVHLTVTADVADEVHLHTYDLMVDLEEGAPGSIDFTASIPGIFEVELEGSALHLIDLEVG